MSAFDKHQFDITCPRCGQVFKRSAGRLNAVSFIRCPGCRRRLFLNKKRFAWLDKANAVLAKWDKFRNWRSRR